MNWLFVALIVGALVSVILGYRRGFVRTALSMVFLFLVIFLSGWLSPHVSSVLQEHTQITQSIQKACEDMLLRNFEGQIPTQMDSQEKQKEFLEEAGLPEELLEKVLPTTGAVQDTEVQALAERTAGALTELVVDGIVFLLSFAAAWIAVRMIMKLTDLFMELPVIGFVNRALGGLLGMARALVLIWLFFIILTIFSGTEWGMACLRAVKEESILFYLYQNNLVLRFFLTAF